ncbi:hypothetical protein PoB_003838100 [Plakobranchus ocellatus]|uniref:Complement Clr-like EGF domain-containing protein n=1 Tax=Plakobranchus ocellatus TaxID=259542 RepID=A0AAV4AL29_9GAST|nr:hypothetical protein PoB_003838100 [Plakobranchus ocellatus]
MGNEQKFYCKCWRGFRLHPDGTSCIVSPIPFPFFSSNNSYLELPSLRWFDTDYMDIERMVKAMSSDCNILYSGDSGVAR